MKRTTLLIIVIIIACIVWGIYFCLGPQKTSNGIAAFCEQQFLEIKNKEKTAANNGVTTLFSANVDQDAEKESIGLCSVSPYGNRAGDPYYTFFILDDAAHNYAVITKDTKQESQRHLVFENLEVVDVNKDGINEVLYKEAGWAMGSGATNSISMYSPIDHQTYVITEDVVVQIPTSKITKTVSFSKNISAAPEGFQQQLQKRFDAWTPRPFIDQN